MGACSLPTSRFHASPDLRYNFAFPLHPFALTNLFCHRCHPSSLVFADAAQKRGDKFTCCTSERDDLRLLPLLCVPIMQSALFGRLPLTCRCHRSSLYRRRASATAAAAAVAAAAAIARAAPSAAELDLSKAGQHWGLPPGS
jgi:hypothetical protein